MFGPAPGRGVAVFELAVYVGFLAYFIRVARKARENVQQQMLDWGITANLILLSLAVPWWLPAFRTIGATVGLLGALFLSLQWTYRGFVSRGPVVEGYPSRSRVHLLVRVVVFSAMSLAALYLQGGAQSAPYPPDLVVYVGVVSLGWIFLPRLQEMARTPVFKVAIRAGLVLLSANVVLVVLGHILWEVYFLELGNSFLGAIVAGMNAPVIWAKELICDFLEIPSFYDPTPTHEVVVMQTVSFSLLVIWWFFLGFVISVGRKLVSATKESN